MPEDESNCDAATEMARLELKKLLKDMPDEESLGALKILEWQKKWYLQVGHQRLGRILVEFA
jgi:hypothetical protein